LAVVETGQALIDAKAALPFGQWARMVESDLPFSESTAQRLMGIAGHAVLSNPAHARVLPNAWTTLAELSRIEPERLERFIAAGEVGPETERADATRLVNIAYFETQADDDETQKKSEADDDEETADDPPPDEPLRMWRDAPPHDGLTLDRSLPTGPVSEVLQNIAREASPPIDRLAVLRAAFEACDAAQRAAFLNAIEPEHPVPATPAQPMRLKDAAAVDDAMRRVLNTIDIVVATLEANRAWMAALDCDGFAEQLVRQGNAIGELLREQLDAAE
jgi:hypothetical protein